MSAVLNPEPYIPIENKDFDELVIELRNQDFVGKKEQFGKIAIVFQFCLIRKLTLTALDRIEFGEVSIMFNNCFIKDFETGLIASENVSIIIHSSLFSGRIVSTNLQSFSISNCILENSIYLSGIPMVNISYTTENIFPYLWKKFFDKIGVVDYKKFLAQDQRYHVENPKNLKITSSRKETDKTGVYRLRHNTRPEYMVGYKLSHEEEMLLKAHVSVEYKDDTHLQTTVNNIKLYSLTLSGNPVGIISVEHTDIGNWYLPEFSPQEDVGFYDINPIKNHGEETKVGIHRSNLDKVWFDNVYFDNFDRLSFYRSKFSNATFTSCSFPEEYETYEKFLPIENIHYPENRTTNHDKDQYEIFLQLKKALEGTSNEYEAQKLKAVSHTALSKVPSITTGDKVILCINRISNNHGLSIKEPFFWFFGLSIPIYLFYLWSVDLLFGTNINPDLIGYYFSFVDITHRNDFLLEKAQLNGLSIAIDSLHKFLIGFVIYQFIAAFRKYGKG